MVNRFTIIITILLAFHSCTKDKHDGSIRIDIALADSLRASPTAVQINSDSLFLKTDVWRDFMPEIGKNGSGLYCANQLTYKDSLPISSGLKLKNQYVVNGNQIWTGQHLQIDHKVPFTIEGVISDGPM